MPKNMRKTSERDSIKASRVKKTSILTGVSIRQIYRVIEGSQKNEKVLKVYMELQEKEEKVFDNLLIKAVKKAVPFE